MSSTRFTSDVHDGFFIVIGNRIKRVSAIHLNGFLESHPKAFEQLFPGPLLAIHPGNFLDPTNPPLAVLFYDCCILIHCQNLNGCIKLTCINCSLFLAGRQQTAFQIDFYLTQ